MEAASKGGPIVGRLELVRPTAVVIVAGPEVPTAVATAPEESPAATAPVIPALPEEVPALVKVAVMAVLG